MNALRRDVGCRPSTVMADFPALSAVKTTTTLSSAFRSLCTLYRHACVLKQLYVLKILWPS